jgi:predicted dehydrogenase
MNRRQFVIRSAAAAQVGSSLLRAATRTAARTANIRGANDRLRIGVIGCGGMGNAHLNALMKMRESDNIEIAAVCDVYKVRLDAAKEKTGGKAVSDYRAVLDDKDIDYVLIATPEHWHHQMTLDAADAGKHIYCEKPLAHTIAEGRQVVQKIQHSGVKMQVGVQGMSDDSYEAAYKYIKDGALGKIVIAQIDYSRNYKDDFWAAPAYAVDPEAQPGVNLDWKAWLGPAPKRPWDPLRYFQWRRYWDYSGGIATDLFIHRITRLIKAMNLKFPDRVVATGGTWEFTNTVAEVPETFNMMCDYPGGPSMVLISSMANDTPVPHQIRGHLATLEFNSTGFVIKPQKLFAEGRQEIVHQKTGAESVTLHHRNLQNAIRKNEPLNCDVLLGYYGLVACLMAVESYRHKKYLAWDARRERVVMA